ncbi:NEL-type E3 ubiquitin ligase domain-containing protein [Falsirhodobacter sp. 20TX0035]|uniref:NEL-type E3 ubiquitin ligase domain-containing protein n=1 Tax=Falsirhodobacter sp. 20TX0035 TaxID=3022019 RepID=UPI00232F7829|nr:NEL-type E3 ubiquitin ligase domain-containing protein [Falsirhodobacter sp. 20TX0035]MDB6454049.1 NEL-type E3 ubiquitin ligase domain-containing protein [Falsirhodobacter sp. 20TX0035]
MDQNQAHSNRAALRLNGQQIRWIAELTGESPAVDPATHSIDAIIAPPTADIPWEQALDDWAAEAHDPDEDRATAVARIRAWSQDAAGSETPLDLSALDLTSLPTALPAGVLILDLSSNAFTTLPDTLPDTVQELKLNSCGLTALPDRLPQGLQRLEVSHNELTRLPDSLPPGLKALRAHGNELATLPDTLPEGLETIGVTGNKLTALPGTLPSGLRSLDARKNELTALPDTLPEGLVDLKVAKNAISELPATLPSTLTNLDASGNWLDALPETLPAGLTDLNVRENVIEQLPGRLPPALKELNAAQNALTALPDRVPDGVTYLDVSDNNLAEVPDSLIENFASPGVIHLNGNPIGLLASAAILEARDANPGLWVILDEERDAVVPEGWLAEEEGSEASYDSDEEAEPEALTQSVGAWLNDDALARQWTGFAEETGAKAFGDFLDRLSGVETFQSPAMRAAVASNIREATQRENLRQKFFLVSFSATTRCDDRVTYIWNDMQIARVAADVEDGLYDDRLDALLDKGRQMYRTEKLADIARAKADALGYGEDNEHIQVHLAYQVKLREALDLDLIAPDMKYFDATDVEEDDLALALRKVRGDEARKFPAYFAGKWEPWALVMQRLAPEDYDAMQEELEEETGAPLAARVKAELEELGLTGDHAADLQKTLFYSRQMEREKRAALTRKILEARGLSLETAQAS